MIRGNDILRSFMIRVLKDSFIRGEIIMPSLKALIKSRKSFRSFDGKGLKKEDLEKLKNYAEGIENPFGIHVRFVFLDADKEGLSSPVLTGEKYYVAGIVEKREMAEAAFGFAFEKLVLYAWSLGIGTTWIGGTMKRENFEKAAGLGKNEMMPCVSPLGYPASKMSFRENMMRRGVKADSRMDAKKFCFEESFDRPLSEEKKKELGDLIEMVRWAPSAVNKQPWRVLVKNGLYHFYEKRDKGYVSDKTGDLQKIDLGIALCHFVMGAEEKGKKALVLQKDPCILTGRDMVFIASVLLE